jgi:hypothetical protein
MTAGKFKYTQKERAEMRRFIRRALDAGNEIEFMKILRQCGVKDEDSRFSRLVTLFREERGGKA